MIHLNTRKGKTNFENIKDFLFQRDSFLKFYVQLKLGSMIKQ